MNKYLSSNTSTVFIFILVFIVPNLFFHQINSEDRDIYYKRVDRDREICLQRAKEDSVETRWCNEIKSSSELAYNSADKSFEIGLLMNLFLPVIYALLITTRNLGEKWKN